MNISLRTWYYSSVLIIRRLKLFVRLRLIVRWVWFSSVIILVAFLEGSSQINHFFSWNQSSQSPEGCPHSALLNEHDHLVWFTRRTLSWCRTKQQTHGNVHEISPTNTDISDFSLEYLLFRNSLKHFFRSFLTILFLPSAKKVDGKIESEHTILHPAHFEVVCIQESSSPHNTVHFARSQFREHI